MMDSAVGRREVIDGISDTGHYEVASDSVYWQIPHAHGLTLRRQYKFEVYMSKSFDGRRNRRGVIVLRALQVHVTYWTQI